MNKNGLPDFPSLFETIGEFLHDAQVPRHQQAKLRAARQAFEPIVKTLYYRVAKVYPCITMSKISPMPLSRAAK
jgi:hypothetical protein